MYQFALATLPILIFIAVFFFSLRDRKKKETFIETSFMSFLPAIFTRTFSGLSMEKVISLIEGAGYHSKLSGEKLFFQNASTLEKHRNWLWSFGAVSKKTDGSFQCKLYLNPGAVITVPAALLVVIFYGLLVQNNLPPDRTSVFPYFFLGFGIFFAVSSLISQTIKERKYFKEYILNH
ncbi:hypothetical protein EHQ27_04580 [Leptospira wolffii]|uniref:Uncharacterized protein n=1 Tax=Leptospira wolffii TaxID=409998 RepID=A0A2M9Z9C1_9LEPT|nr:hypothetical protein [Leptospira wolffii]PJZ64942.1 hypothetical protein CH371_15690 [Leptospira wolffii]TGK58149.1 hypothetical protein EHQ32_12690 [Leptospira wolffii]TGK68828.1 hypothetical protein EHQ35_18560 [Leptospira wolffii]TGK76332.1 hypothetical protein EHQ27_04580 [Leptospira wolffii]TGL27180.1 hypothetical protein EHQ57_16540 [Leptospira wolffii]